ncbi:hypothetical protein QB607_003167 [Clostridium botulinum]|nr:hypothetical protein [Clostridium botulinum]EKS4395840.1 hypothetical protein [Clostridium botulinum]
MKYSLNYIRTYMNYLDNITEFNSKDIKLEISTRMTNTYAYNQMIFVYSENKRERILNVDKMVFSEALLNCGASENQIQDVIKHEYCHAWADKGKHSSCGHCGVSFIKRCKTLGCDRSGSSNDKSLDTLIDNYLKQRKIDKLKKSNYRKLFNYIMSNVRYIDEVNIRTQSKYKNGYMEVKLIVSDKYPCCKNLFFLFNKAVENIIKNLNEQICIAFNNKVEYKEVKNCRKAYIKYKHSLC